jgi:heat shock protein HtpX
VLERPVSPFLDDAAISAHKLQNTVHSALLLGGLGAILAATFVLLMGWHGLGWAAIVVGLMLALVPRIPPEALMTVYRARAVDAQRGGQLSELVAIIAGRAGLAEPPRLYVIPSMTLNAFAVGQPSHAVIGVTEGLLRRLTLREIAGVLAHEMSHVRNNDLGVMGIADVLTRLTQAMSYVAVVLMIANLLAALQGEEVVSWLAVALLYLAPSGSSLLQLALSRTREYDADLEAARLTGDPLGLASALRRLERYTGRFWEDLMLPVPGRRVPFPSLLRSHPTTEDRIERLIALTGQPMLPAIVVSEQPMISLAGFGPGEMRPRYRFPGLWF